MSSFKTLAYKIVLVCLVAFPLHSKAGTDKEDQECEGVPFRVISAREYSSFPVWDQKISEKLYANIRSLEEYRKSFHGVFFPGTKSSPPESFFENKQILAVALTMKAVAPEDWDRTFTVQKVENCGGHLSLYYKVNPMPSVATWVQKNSLTVAIKKEAFDQVSFVEEGQPVRVLEITQGQWRYPSL